MAVTTTNVLSLGSFAELDTNESSTGSESANLLIGHTFGTTGTPLWASRVQMTMNDGNNSGTIPFTNKTANPTENIMIGNPPGPALSIDGGTKYFANITYWDGTTATGEVRILQDGQGNLYILPPPRSASASEISAMTAKPITTISITGISQNNYSELETSRFGLPNDPSFPCFCYGTLIRTLQGDKPVETLAAGDMILSSTGEILPLRWIGSRRLGAAILALTPSVRPIRIRAGALGTGVPAQDLLVSPQHRILVRSRIAKRMFGSDEVLVAAKHLLEIEGVEIAAEIDEVTYFHLLFDRHEVILANDTATESLYTGTEALGAIGPEARDEIISIFPELAADDHDAQPARPLATGRRGRQLAARHARNAVPLMISKPAAAEARV